MKTIDRKNGPWPRNPYPEPVKVGKYRNAEGEEWHVVNSMCPKHLRREHWRIEVLKQPRKSYYYWMNPKKFVQWFDGPSRVVKWRKDRLLGPLKVGWTYINKCGQERDIISIQGDSGIMEKHHQVEYVFRPDEKEEYHTCTVETFRKWFNGKGQAA